MVSGAVGGAADPKIKRIVVRQARPLVLKCGIEKNKAGIWKREVNWYEIMHFGVAEGVRIVRGIGSSGCTIWRYARRGKPEAR